MIVRAKDTDWLRQNPPSLGSMFRDVVLDACNDYPA